LSASELVAERGKLSLIDRWRLGHAYAEAQRNQLNEILATQYQLLLDKLALLKEHSKTQRQQSVALTVETIVAQADEKLTEIRRARTDQRNKHINEITLKYFDDVMEIENHPKLPDELKDIRLDHLKSDYFALVEEIRSGELLKKYGMD